MSLTSAGLAVLVHPASESTNFLPILPPSRRHADLLWLEDGDGAAGWILEDGHPSDVGNFLRTHVDGGAEGARLISGLLNVFYADISEPAGVSTGHGDHAASGAFVGLERAVDAVRAHVHVLKLPAEERAVERLCFGEIGRIEFEVDEWICHAVFPLRMEDAECLKVNPVARVSAMRSCVTAPAMKYQEGALEAMIPAVEGALAAQIPRRDEENEDGDRGPAEELHGKGGDEASAVETLSRRRRNPGAARRFNPGTARRFLEDQSADQGDSGGHGQQLERVPDGLLKTRSGDQERRVEDGVEREDAQQ